MSVVPDVPRYIWDLPSQCLHHDLVKPLFSQSTGRESEEEIAERLELEHKERREGKERPWWFIVWVGVLSYANRDRERVCERERERARVRLIG